jgi:NAD-dependent SIR2 family protein deacetylase
MNVDKLHVKAGSKQVIEVYGEFSVKEQVEALASASTYQGIVLYDDVAPRCGNDMKWVKSLEYCNSHSVHCGNVFFIGISQKLLKLVKQRKASAIVTYET